MAITNYAAAKNMLKDNADVGILTDQILTFPIGIGFNKTIPNCGPGSTLSCSRAKPMALWRRCTRNGSTTIWTRSKCQNSKTNPSGRKVVLGVAIGDLPSAGYVDGEYGGFDIELIQTFAAQENINLQPFDGFLQP